MLARRSAQRCSAAGAVITIGRADFLAGSVRGLKTFPRRRRAFATLVPNVAFGPVSRLDEPFSFWGGFVSATDTIIDSSSSARWSQPKLRTRLSVTLANEQDWEALRARPASRSRLARTALRSAPTLDLTPKARAARAKVRTLARSGLDGDRPASAWVSMRSMIRALR